MPGAWLDACAQAELVRRGDATPVELVDAAIARIEQLNPSLNAVIHPMFAKAKAQAASPALPNGPFRGVPIVMKDLWAHTADDPYTCGMRMLRDRAWREPEDSEIARKLRAAGFVFVGRTNVPELGLMPTTEPDAFGPTRNPWNVEHSVGGSSGGSAAAVASGMVAIGHATDGGGSIRLPASACGLVGLKPSRGRVWTEPEQGGIAGFSVQHVLSRSVRDSAAVLEILAAPSPHDPEASSRRPRPYSDDARAEPDRLVVGFTRASPANATPVHPDCVAAVDEAARLFESLGHEVEEAHPDALDEPEQIIHVGAVTGADTALLLDHWSARTGERIGPDDVEANTWGLAEMGRTVTPAMLAESLEWFIGYARRMAKWWERFDLLLTPTMGEPPPRLGEFVSTPELPLAPGVRGWPIAAFTTPWNATGQPAISLPLHRNDAGLPVGVQLVAAYGLEHVLIQVAAQLEAARPWIERLPPLSAPA